MREIKFRAWDKLNNEWCAIDMAYSDATQGPISKPTVFNGRNQCVIMQYTGLIDANATEVYEGDVLKVTNPFTKRSVIKPVWWNGETARFNGIPTSLTNVYEVIGNIYENPELLEQPNDQL